MATFRQISERIGGLTVAAGAPAGYVPGYRRLSGQLLDCMAIDSFEPGDKFYSIREVAEVSDVSRITVHGAFRELAKKGFLSLEPRKAAIVKRIPSKNELSERTVELVEQDAALEESSSMQNRDNLSVWNEASTVKQLHLGVILSQWDSGDALSWDNREILPTILERASADGISIQVIPSSLATNDPVALDAQVIGSKLNGLLWLSMRDKAIVSASRWAGRPFVQLAVKGCPDNLDIPIVAEDNFLAGMETARLVAQGDYQSVLVLCGSESVNTYPQRLNGYRSGMGSFGLDSVPHRFIELSEGRAKEWFVPVIASALAESKATLIVSLLDVMESLHAVFEISGLRVGTDLDLISFSPPESLGWEARVPFRFWRPRLREIGVGAVEAWLECWKRAENHPSTSDWRKISRKVPMDFGEYFPKS